MTNNEPVTAKRLEQFRLFANNHYMSKHQDLQMFDLKLNTTSNFHLLEVVGRGGKTQLKLLSG